MQAQQDGVMENLPLGAALNLEVPEIRVERRL
jgi:hypothetical protein